MKQYISDLFLKINIFSRNMDLWLSVTDKVGKSEYILRQTNMFFVVVFSWDVLTMAKITRFVLLNELSGTTPSPYYNNNIYF